MTTKKKIIVAIIIFIAAFLLYWFIIRKKEDEVDSSQIAENSNSFPLKFGSKGKQVAQLQIYLLQEYGAKTSKDGTIDGVWGNLTQDAVQKFLKKDNLSEQSYNKWNLDKIVTAIK